MEEILGNWNSWRLRSMQIKIHLTFVDINYKIFWMVRKEKTCQDQDIFYLTCLFVLLIKDSKYIYFIYLYI